jgi:L-iduronidase
VWEKQGAPDLPDAAQLAALRAAQEPVCRTRRLRIGSEERRHRVTLDLALPSVALVVLTHQSDRLPAAPIGLRGAIYPGLAGRENVVLSWQAAAQPGIQLFDVFHAVEATGRFVKLNQTPLLSTVHLRARAQGEKGYFKIRARDLFGRGIASEVLQL